MTDDSSDLAKAPFRLITDAEEARAAASSLQQEPIVGVDTETYWEAAANHSRVSLVQIAARAGEVLVFDLFAVDVELLRPLIESPTITMTAHNARFDEAMLAGEGLRPAGFVDTLRLARSALRLPSYSLAGVTAHLFGIELDRVTRSLTGSGGRSRATSYSTPRRTPSSRCASTRSLSAS